jgi:hypothetical protein
MIRATYGVLEFYEQFYLPGRLSRRSPLTDQQMRLSIARIEQYALALSIERLTIDGVDDLLIDGFKAWRKASAATVNKDLRHLRALVNYARRRKFRADQLDFDFEPVIEDEPEAWSTEEFSRILSACRQEEGQICGIAAPAWWTAHQLVILNTGARISAVMKTLASAFDPATGALRITGRVQKQKKGQADVLHPITQRALRKIVTPARDGGLLFPWPFDQNQPQWPALINAYRRILARAGLPTTAKDLFHKLRRTNGTYVTAAADPETARAQLGHSTVWVTRRYIDPTKIKRKTATDLLPWHEIAADDDRQLRLF